MANYPECRLVSDEQGNAVIVATTMSYPDKVDGIYYTLHTTEGKLVNHGHTTADFKQAMKIGVAAARRWLLAERKRKEKASTIKQVVAKPKKKRVGEVEPSAELQKAFNVLLK
ncbi:hypothetical protein HNP46_006358 [Pseudomonas nitritireducens]|uniref:Uncharacterized protein n=1 Tax=Pseudomonas nitroreducens TaxID=46680 RepID=A0A7W7KR51_PSENT|nr:hypothetical protein [Pseudomonas nitritireducens]MBB4867445.1 hypothetical protein [Pseudomonas nitritireducens]